MVQVQQDNDSTVNGEGGYFLGVVGSRTFSQIEKVPELVAHEAARHPDMVLVSGGCRGVDTIALQEAKQRGFPVRVHNNGSRYFNSQPYYERDVEAILDRVDMLYVFWNSESEDEQELIKRAIQYGVPHEILLENNRQLDKAFNKVKGAEATVVHDEDKNFLTREQLEELR